MNRINGFKSAIIVALTFSLLSVMILAGCRKKEQPPQTPPSEQQKNEQEKQIQPPPPPPETNEAVSPPAAPGSEAEGNKPANIMKPEGQEKTGALFQGRKLPGSAQQNTMKTEDLTLDKYDSITASEDKIDFINEFSSEHPEAVADIAKKALSDKELDVRVAAMDAFVGSEPQGPVAMEVLTKAIEDTEEEIRLSAIEACDNIEAPETGKILARGVNDTSDAVREAAIQTAEDKEPVVRMEVLKAGLTSNFADTKEIAVSALADISTPDAVDALIPALKNADPDMRDNVNSALSSMLSQEFETYEQWSTWWNQNRGKLDDTLSEKE